MTDGNDKAFPGQFLGDSLTKREYFAAMALQGLLSHHVKYAKGDRPVNEFVSEPVYKGRYIDTNEDHPDRANLAMDAVELADYLIEELNKP